MKLFEIRLYKLKILQNNEVIYEGISEELPDSLKRTAGGLYDSS